jgi:hypothetical protein
MGMSAWDVVEEMVGVGGVGVEGERFEGETIGGLTLCAMAERRRKAGLRAEQKAGSSQDSRPVRNDMAVGSRSDPRTVRNDIVAAGNFTGKQLGEMAEAEFLAKAAELGLGVARPWGDSNRYDFIVDDDGVLCRVQVKSAHRAGANGSYSIRTHGHSGRSYEASEIDALAAWVAPEDAWYLFPVRVVRRLRTMKLFPASRRKRSKFEKWRETWWVLSRRLKRMV